MRFVALLRVSTATQARDGYGLESQEADIRAWAKLHGHRIAYVIREPGVSGTTPLIERTGLAEALQLLSANKADGLVVARLDRLARDLILQEQLIAEVDALGRVLRSAAPIEDDHLLDKDPQRVLVRQIIGAISAYERAMIRVRLMNGLRMKAAAGGYLGGGPPYGWIAKGSELVPDPDEQEVRQRIKLWRRQGLSYGVISARLNTEGIPAKKGGRWSKVSVHRVANNITRASHPRPASVEREAG